MNNSLEGNILFLKYTNLLQKIFFLNQIFIFFAKKNILNNTYSFTKIVHKNLMSSILLFIIKYIFF